MDKIEKALASLSEKSRKEIKALIRLVEAGKTKALDLKKLKGREDVFRVRKGKWRIIFHRKDAAISILALERRSETTYR